MLWHKSVVPTVEYAGTMSVTQCTSSCIATNVHTHVTDMIVGLTYLLLMSCDVVRNSSQALSSGGTAASSPPICCSTDVNCSIII